jgi:hypothetical protein
MSSTMPAPASVRSSMKTFVMRLLMIAGLVCAYDLDHKTTPEVVRISNESNMLTFHVSIFEGMWQIETYRNLSRESTYRTALGDKAGPKFYRLANKAGSLEIQD